LILYGRREEEGNFVLKNVEDLILGGLPPAGVTESIEQRKRLATTMIRMTLDRDNSSCFVDRNQLRVFEPKKLCDDTVDFHVSRSSENAATIWDKLIASTWIKGDLERSVTKFRNDFDRLLEIKPKLDQSTLDSVWVHIILRRLPNSFSVISTILLQEMGTNDLLLKQVFKEIHLFEERRSSKDVVNLALGVVTSFNQSQPTSSNNQSSSAPSDQRLKKRRSLLKKNVRTECIIRKQLTRRRIALPSIPVVRFSIFKRNKQRRLRPITIMIGTA
jgi:hypothetical protein